MAEVKIELTGNVKEIAEAEKLFEDDVKALSKTIASILVTDLRRETQNINSVASGKFLNSISSQVFSRTVSDITIEVGSNLPYAEFVEEGRKAGRMPPPERIYEWMIDIGKDEPPRHAWAIAKAIGQRGVEGKHIFRNVVNRFSNRLFTIASSIFER